MPQNRIRTRLRTLARTIDPAARFLPFRLQRKLRGSLLPPPAPGVLPPVSLRATLTSPEEQEPHPDANRTLAISQERALVRFLDHPGTIQIGQQETPPHDKALVSIVLVLFNKAPFSYACLRRLEALRYRNLELVVVDNGSSDRTSALLERLTGKVTILRPGENLHFLRACNLAFQHLSHDSRFVALVNNDALLAEEAINEGLDVFQRWPDTGIVGGQILHLDGRLQEAGNILFRDGSCRGLGRRQSPWQPLVQTRRKVDYVSGCFLLIETKLLHEIGAFDERFAPAYYEETDLCVESWKRNRPVVYEPRCLLHHVEFASSNQKLENAIPLMQSNRKKFLRKHQEWLRKQPDPEDFARSEEINHWLRTSAYDARILWIDDRLPDPSLGAGFGRLKDIIHELANINCFITLFATVFTTYNQAPDLISHANSSDYELEWGNQLDLCTLLNKRAGFYTHIATSRHHNLPYLQALVQHLPPDAPRPMLVGDIESIFSIRNHCQRLLNHGGQIASPKDLRQVPDIARELEEMSVFDRLMAVSEQERQLLQVHTHRPVSLVGHAFPTLDPADRPSFDATRGLLFMGAMNFPGLPNLDSLQWLADAVFPALREQGQLQPEQAPLTVIGPFREELVRTLLDRLGAVWPMRHLGHLDQVEPELRRHRLLLAPTRFAAGLPHKVQHAISQGIPVVTTELIAAQMGWNSGDGLVCSNDAHGFARHIAALHEDEALWKRLQQGGLEKIRMDCQPAALRQALSQTFLTP
ncbi:MAG: glycosyltransferase [Cyanobacteriota bacterium]|nr:glycosyltransferase [Cyanobacteriota bacterium]